MRHNARTLAVLAVALLVAGLVLGYENRHDVGSAGAQLAGILAVLGLVATGGSLLTMISAETSLDGLTVPEAFEPQVAGAPGLPNPSWWGPLGLAALCVGGTGLFVDRYLVGLGTGLLVVAVYQGVMEVSRKRAAKRARWFDTPAVLDRKTVHYARRVQDFAAGHDGVQAVVQGVGYYGVELALVGGNGRTGEVVVPNRATAELVCQLVGVDLLDAWPRELGAQVAHTPRDWRHMGGKGAATRPWQDDDEPTATAPVTPEKTAAETPGPTAAEAGAPQ